MSVFSPVDTLSVVAGTTAGVAYGVPPGNAVIQSLALQIIVKVLAAAPGIIRALKARRAARKAVKKDG